MPKVCTLFCLVDIKKRSFLSSCVLISIRATYWLRQKERITLKTVKHCIHMKKKTIIKIIPYLCACVFEFVFLNVSSHLCFQFSATSWLQFFRSSRLPCTINCHHQSVQIFIISYHHYRVIYMSVHSRQQLCRKCTHCFVVSKSKSVHIKPLVCLDFNSRTVNFFIFWKKKIYDVKRQKMITFIL